MSQFPVYVTSTSITGVPLDLIRTSAPTSSSQLPSVPDNGDVFQAGASFTYTPTGKAILNGHIYMWRDTDWQDFSDGSGTVLGPALSTNNAIPRWNGTAGDEIKNSPITVDDVGNMAGIAGLLASGTAIFGGGVAAGGGVIASSAGGTTPAAAPQIEITSTAAYNSSSNNDYLLFKGKYNVGGDYAQLGHIRFSKANGTDADSTGEMALAINPGGGATASLTALYIQSGTTTSNQPVVVTKASASTSGSGSYLRVTPVADTGISASTNNPLFWVNSTNATRTWAAGAITTNQENRFGQPTWAFGGASTVTTATTLAVMGAPIAGTNATFTNAYAAVISGGTVTGTITNGYGLRVDATSGATNNYGLYSSGALNGFGVSAPASVLHAQTATGAQVALLERSGQSTNAAFPAARILATRSTTMGNGFGPAIVFSAQDSNAVINDIATVSSVIANSSSTTGNLLFTTVAAGSASTVLTLDYLKSATFAGTTDSSSITTGTIICNGGAGIAKSLYVGTATTLNTTAASANTTINGSSGSVWTLNNGSMPYNGAGNDLFMKIVNPTSSNAGTGLQLSANYTNTPLDGWIFQSRYGENSSYRTNADMAISQYIVNNPISGAAVNAWETRLLMNSDRSFKFSITGSGTNDVILAATGATISLPTTISPAAATSGTPRAFTITPAADTGLTASTEVSNFRILSSTKSWAAGTITNQRFSLINQPTVAFASASTVTNCSTIAINGAPIAGTNATISNSYAAIIDGGTLTGTVTAAYGMRLIAPSGATSNYAAYIQGSVGINTATPSASAILDLTSTTQAFLPPRMTTAQKGAITNVAGLVVFDTTLGKLCVNNGAAWETITSV